MELIIAIATLCHVGTNMAMSYSDTDRVQLTCQQYYVDCTQATADKYGTKDERTAAKLTQCIKERKVK